MVVIKYRSPSYKGGKAWVSFYKNSLTANDAMTTLDNKGHRVISRMGAEKWKKVDKKNFFKKLQRTSNQGR